ncbi:MAG: hypothetical protein PW788_08040 [Micavibrio sp.]|nr:hypothetical protein [Micavibrio sp.]
MALDLDALFVISEHGPDLDRAEAQLRTAGNPSLADKLFKLQQDVGLEIDNEMTGSFGEPAPGPASAALRAAYEPLTPARLAVLQESHAALNDAALKATLAGIIAKLPAAQAPRVTAPRSAP